MSDVKKIATRDSYGNALAELGAEFPNLYVLDADLAAATKTSTFKKAFPERHIDCGIAEANMTGIAAGLATCGIVPFISSFAMFAAGRNFEQVRNSIGYPHLNVKIGATHAGISVGEDLLTAFSTRLEQALQVIPVTIYFSFFITAFLLATVRLQSHFLLRNSVSLYADKLLLHSFLISSASAPLPPAHPLLHPFRYGYHPPHSRGYAGPAILY